MSEECKIQSSGWSRHTVSDKSVNVLVLKKAFESVNHKAIQAKL